MGENIAFLSELYCSAVGLCAEGVLVRFRFIPGSSVAWNRGGQLMGSVTECVLWKENNLCNSAGNHIDAHHAEGFTTFQECQFSTGSSELSHSSDLHPALCDTPEN